MTQSTKIILLTIAGLCLLACEFNGHAEKELQPVSVAQFENFVNSTGYLTDAERYGWSIVQTNVFDFEVVEEANWRKPDGKNLPASKDLPVTQVSYNDALAYCDWAGTRLPTYDEYWTLIQTDDRDVISDNRLPISAVKEVNVLGNVWELTDASRTTNVRLAGGSLFCSQNTCNGTVRERELYVDKETGNIHIGFAVLD
ncbi:MAG: SUMF1/EgtB/PvdO family nonheme iron enzyme [Bacteroidota bacterium]